ncbi:unnamed protein product [Triticum turgidum subsp. durum]|uniref:Uncharacterized protein n=1 Tax=Triticum turgidum subsp. durum TaxID=4567 RepID=A0A9R0XHJ4_TRITD|nr:unnamed protein product [Triticum turgidum subsp. durum]
MQFQSGNCAKTLAKVDGSGAKDLSVGPSTFGFPQDANQEYFNQACQCSYPVSTQGFPDLPSVPDFVLNNASAALREYQQFDHFFRPLQPLAPDGNQVQNSGINTAHRSRPSNASSCLDHVEEITSHDTDGYDDRAISFGSSCSTGIACYPYSSPMQSDDCIADTQDGTWAALMQMQQALEAANDECSDLTFNNTELSGGNTMQHQVVWDNGCLASPSFTSNFLPFPGEAETTVTSTSAMFNLHNSVDLPYDNDQDISSFELKVAEQKEATTSHVCEHRDEMHSAEQGGNPGHDGSFDLTITQDRQFSSFVNGANGSVDSGMNLYDCEEQMEIDSLLSSFGASSDTFAQTYEMLQKGENIVDLEKKAKLAESISATFMTNTVPYITQAGVTESTVSDGSSWTQQYQSTSQSCGLSYSSASQWETMPGTVFPLGGCRNDVSESNSMTSLGTNGDLLLSFGHTSMQQQQSLSSDTNLELIDNFANPCQEFVMGMDGQRSHLYRDEALATQGVWAAHPDTMVHSSTDTGRSDVQLPMTQTTTVPLPAPRLSKGPNSLFIGTELKKVDLHHTGMRMPLTQTTVQLPAPCLSKDPNSSFIGAEVQKVDQNHSDMQLPLTQTSHVQLPAMNLSEYPTSSFVGGTKLKKVDKHDSYMQLPMTHASHVPLPATSLSEDPKSSFIGGTELKAVNKHDSDMQLPRIQASHVPLPAVSLSEEPNSSFIGGTELKEVGKHDSDMPLPMTQASHVPLPAVRLSEDTKSSFIAGAELKEVDKHDSDTPLPMAQASHVPLPTMSLPEDTKSSFIGGTELKEVDKHDSDMQPPITPASHAPLPAVSLSEDPKSSFTGGTELKEVGKHDSDMQHPMTPASHVLLPSVSMSRDPKSSFTGGTELKEVGKHDSDMQLSMTQTVHVHLPTPSLSKDSESSFVGGTELEEVDKHDSDMQPPRTQASHVPLPAVSLSEDPNSSFIGGTELKEVGKHDSDIQLPITQTVCVQLPAMSLSEDPKSSFIKGTELKEVDKDDSDIPLPVAQARHVPLPTMSLPEDTKSSFIGGTELKEVDKHDSDMQPPITPASHVPLPAVSLSEDPKSSFTGGTELKEVAKHDSDMQLPMTQTVRLRLHAPSMSKDSELSFVGGTELKEVDKHDSDMQPPMTQASLVPLPAVSLSEDPNSSFIGGTELKQVDKHDSDMQPPMTQTSLVPLPAVSLSEDPNSSFIGGTELKEVGKHDSDIQPPMTQTVRVQLPAMSLSEDPKSSFIKGTELKEVDKHDLGIPLPMAQAGLVPLPTVSLPEDTKSSFIGGTELKEVDKHDSDMQPPITPAIHVLLPAVSLSEDPKSSFTGGTELKEVGKHDSDMQLPMTHTVRVQLPAPSLSKDPDSAFVGRTELKKVGHIGYPQQSILLSASKPSHPIGLPVIKFDDEVGSRSKKRKRSTEDVLASHAQAMFEGGRLQCRRTPELAWADATLTEKVDGEKATSENSTFVSRAQRRLTLTTSLIQCLLPALSARLLAAKVADCGEAIVYHICKLVLSDMSDPVQSFVSDTNNFMQSENMPPNETSTSGKEDRKLLSEVLETFDVRLGGLQSSLSRIENMPSFQDYAAALHQIEQWSMTHQFIKLNEYKRLHAGYGSGPKRPLCVGAIRKHAGGSSAPVSELKRIRCRSLK